MGKIPWRREYSLLYSCLENSIDRGAWQAYSPWGPKELDNTKLISNSSLVWSLGGISVIICFLSPSLNFESLTQPALCSLSPLHTDYPPGPLPLPSHLPPPPFSWCVSEVSNLCSVGYFPFASGCVNTVRMKKKKMLLG